MKVKSDISLQAFLVYLKLGAITSEELGKLKSVRLPRKAIRDVKTMKWSDFIEIETYHADFRNSITFLSKLIKESEYKVSLMRVDRAYPLWRFYSIEIQKIMKGLNNTNSELPKGKSKKSMDVFGLTNITDFLAKAKNTTLDDVDTWSVSKVIVEYTREVYIFINQLDKIKKRD